MLDFDFSEKGLWLVFTPHFVYDFSRKNVTLTDHISLSDSLYLSRYWAICILQLFVHQAVTSSNLKLSLSFWSSRFDIWPKSQGKNLNISRKKRAFEVKSRTFFIIFKGLSVNRNCLSPEKASLIKGEGSSLPSCLFLWASIAVHTESKWVCKGDC